MTAADKIAEARALIEPLTEYAPGPWKVDSDGDVYADNSFSIAQIWDIVEDFSEHAETKLILSAPALRDTVAALADLADAQAQEIARLREALELQVIQTGGWAELFKAEADLVSECRRFINEVGKESFNRARSDRPGRPRKKILKDQERSAWAASIMQKIDARASHGETP